MEKQRLYDHLSSSPHPSQLTVLIIHGGGASMKGNIWAQVLARLEISTTRHEFMKWLQPTALAADDGHTLEIRVMDEHTGAWLEKHYLPAIREALTASGRQGVDVQFVVGPPVMDTKPTRGKGPQGKPLDFEHIEPWEDAVDGAALLADLARAFERFLSLPAHASTALALWVLHTYTHDAAFFSPVIAITSPIKGCGKTSVLIVLGSLVYRRQFASNLTSAVLFRLVDRFQPTLLIDEADTFLPENDQLRGLLNSGHTKATAWLIRNVGEDYDPRKFHTWCPKAVAAIGRLPGTLEDRSIQIRMKRRRRLGDDGARVERLRSDQIDGWHLPLRRRAARWADDHLDALRQSDAEVPGTLADRAADCWRPLLAIADECGGEWPAKARAAAEALSQAAFADDQEPVIELLRDLAALLAPPPDQPGASPTLVVAENGLVPSANIVAELARLSDRPWATWRGDRPITQQSLAGLLKPLGIYPAESRQWGVDGEHFRGYRLGPLQDAFARYLPFSGYRSGSRDATNVYGAVHHDQVGIQDPENPDPIVVYEPDFIDKIPGSRPVPGKRGVIPLIPALKGSLRTRRGLPSRTLKVAKGKVN